MIGLRGLSLQDAGNLLQGAFHRAHRIRRPEDLLIPVDDKKGRLRISLLRRLDTVGGREVAIVEKQRKSKIQVALDLLQTIDLGA